MQQIIQELQQSFQAKLIREPVFPKQAWDTYLETSEDNFPRISEFLAGEKLSLIDIFAAEDFEEHPGFTLFYVFEEYRSPDFLVLINRLKGELTFSVASNFPSASYFERKVRDGFGIEFKGAFDTRRLFLHETYPNNFHPMLKSFKNQSLQLDNNTAGREYIFRQCDGKGVYQIPVGPVHAGIIEPGHFRFSVIGETIFDLEIRHFYTHRGLEKLAEGKSPLECSAIAESISGDESAANTLAFCLALELISGTPVPLRACQLRTVLVEMERIYSHLGDLAGMSLDVAYPLGANLLFALREEILRQNAIMTGSRFLKGIIVPGGLKHDCTTAQIIELTAYLNTFWERLGQIISGVYGSSWIIDRFETTGIIEKRLVHPLNLSGPIARASGVDRDTRRDHPYGIYQNLHLNPPVRSAGDVLARFQIKAEEIEASVLLIRDILSHLDSGSIHMQYDIRDGYSLAVVESARGQTCHWVYVKNGIISRYNVRTASFCNWPAIEHAVIGNIVADFPLINKSMNLSYAGNDL
jgi:Ni,Fe-hydrogenase III large subunit/Ni,Fe-hydrogenase III component G